MVGHLTQAHPDPVLAALSGVDAGNQRIDVEQAGRIGEHNAWTGEVPDQSAPDAIDSADRDNNAPGPSSRSAGLMREGVRL